MVKEASLVSALESIAGAEALIPAAELPSYAVDGIVPRAAAAPDTYEGVAEVLRYADREKLAIIPLGGGAHAHIGNVPARYDIALSTARLTGIVEHEPADLTLTCRAGTTLAELQRHLVAAGQTVPFGPAWDDASTVGGLLAAGRSGPSRHRYGGPRDFTIGLKVATADGRLTKAGGRVVKNVAGYDLVKLYVGSAGTLCVILEATFKLAPLPKDIRKVSLACESPAAACATARDLRRRGLALQATVLTRADDGWRLLIDLAGTPRAVERSLDEIEGAEDAATDCAAAWAATDRLTEPPSLLCRAFVLPTSLPELIDTLETAGGDVFALPTLGVAYAAWWETADIAATLSRAREATAAVGGSLVIERCPVDIKRGLDVFGEPPPSFGLMRTVKREFDPKGTLSPGRHVGRL